MIRRIVLSLVVLGAVAFVGAKQAEAGNCYRGGYRHHGGYYGGGGYRSVYYSSGPRYHRGGYYGPRPYYGGYHPYYGGYRGYPGRGGVSFSIGF